MQQPQNQRYEVREALGAGGMGAVYAAYDRLTGTRVALKRVQITSAMPTAFDFQLALAQEFRLLASLRHPHIISVLDYGFDAAGQPFFTMELLEGAQTLRQFAASATLETRVALILQALEALRYLHRRGIVHRDLKPENVLIITSLPSPDPSPLGKEAENHAFGDRGEIVKVLDFGLAQEGTEKQSAGTLAYLAPEVLQGAPATALSDLYALGMMLYEVIAGAHPFKTEHLSKWIQAILTAEPDVDSLAIPASLKQVIRRMVARDPAERYPNADAVMTALREAMQLTPTPESQTTRESFLQAARFVGREAELGKLIEALSSLSPSAKNGTSPLHEAQGAAFLIGGESGVGKSRLVEELRIRALVAGALTLRGQAVADSHTPYQLWRDPVRRLILSLDISHAEAGILQSIVPDIGDLLHRPVKRAGRLDGTGGQQRLAQTVLALFQRATQPVTLILEDVHWAGSESLLLLKLLAEHIAELPLVMVATYRDDERPHLPDDLPDMKILRLPRLTNQQMKDLSISMLGDNGRIPDLVELLRRETEGNVFFIVEVVRALAESAGKLSDVGLVTLPPRIFSGGMKTVIERRLAAVPEEAEHLLYWAALLGRKPDMGVLRVIVPNADALLMQCGEAAVMTIDDGAWQFAHDKLRETLLQNIIGIASFHQRIAEVMAQLYGDAPDYAPALAQHWAGAGSASHEAHYSLIAGESALHRSSYQAAQAYLNRALELEAHLTDTSEQARLRLILGETCYTLGDYPRARTLLTECAEKATDPNVQARALNLLGNIALAFGEFAPARAALTQAIAATDDPQEQGRATRSLGVVTYNEGRPDDARRHYEQALVLLRHSDDSVGIAGTLSNLAALAHDERRYTDAEALYAESIALFKSVNFLWGIAYGTTQLGMTRLANGDAVGARREHETALAICQQIGHQWGIAFSSDNLAETCLVLGDFTAVHTALHEALAITTRLNITATALDTCYLYGALWVELGDTVNAVEVLAFVEAQPKIDVTTRPKIEKLLDRLQTQLDTDAFADALKRGVALSFEDVVSRCTGWQFMPS
jgi:eukaryotic-like serine/threonine-protein kinase